MSATVRSKACTRCAFAHTTGGFSPDLTPPPPDADAHGAYTNATCVAAYFVVAHNGLVPSRAPLTLRCVPHSAVVMSG